MKTTTVRITRETSDVLRELAAQSGRSLQDVLAAAVEAYRRQVLLDETNAVYAAIRAEPGHWSQEEAERADWEATLADNLERE